MRPDPWSGLALAVSRDRALLGPEGAALVVALVAGAERVARRDGIRLSPQLVGLRDVLQPVAAAGIGHADVRKTPLMPTWTKDEIDIEEASTMLQRSTRQTRRLVVSGVLGPARRTGRAWAVSRAEVAAYAAQREETSA